MSSLNELHPEILETSSNIVEDSESGDEMITYRRRKWKRDEGSGEIAAKNASNMASSSVAERLRVRSDKKPLYTPADTDSEDEPFVVQRKKPKVETPSEKAKSEKLRANSDKKPAYKTENSDFEDEPFVSNKRESTMKGTVEKGKKLRADDKVEPFVYKRRKPKAKETVEKKLVRNTIADKLRDRSKNKPLYKVDYSDNEDEVPFAQRSRRLIEGRKNLKSNSLDKRVRIANDSDDEDGEQMHNVDGSSEKSEKSIQDNQNLARSSTVEKLRDRSKKQPIYRVDDSDDSNDSDDSDDSDDMPIAQSMRLKKEKTMKENMNLKSKFLEKGVHIVDDSDEDELPIKHLKGKHKADHPSEMTENPVQGNLSSTSCYSGRHGARSSKRPLYNDDESDDLDAHIEPNSRHKSKDVPEKIIRDETKKDACQVCGESDDLIGCGTCTNAFHKACLLPPQKASLSNSWSCSECTNPLGEIEKILDSEMRPVSFKIEACEEGQDQNSARHYLVKWKGLSYLHCSWIAEDEFFKAFNTHYWLRTKLNKFKAKMESVDTLDDEFIAIRPEWTTVDRIIARRKTSNGCEYFVKWKELGYDECTWELESDISAFKSQIERFHVIHSRGRKGFCGEGSSRNQGKESSKDNYKDFHCYDETPNFLSGTLHPYQLEGLNFLRYSWSKRTHVILADEMGLGKTIQSIAFLASLYKENRTPHLVVAPLSTLRNWEREFATWAPDMNVIMYCGSASARAVTRQYEFYYPKDEAKKKKKKKADRSKHTRIKFDVLLTSYEMINLDSASMKNIPWECLIVDEGHRLKNKDSKLFLQLKLFSTKQRVLLTGTPLQNNMDELFMLMHFLDDGKFSRIESFQEEFSDIGQEEQIDRLHKMLAPHLLRRVKKDVMKDLPPKKELILRVELSKIQKEYYKAILTRNYEILVRRGGAQVSLINVVMELRKLCCHAYMLEGVEPAIEPSDANEGLRQLLESSGKMLLLDKIMVKLKEEGHRVLIYSQFQHMLDLLEDYLTYKNWIYERIDGRINGAERQIRIDRFNADNSTRFCFLLSTRAGGLGINLATADTVIIYDSDWNPHADLQAMARAHRLGQTNKVMIYRLITRGTIEERMMQLTKKKMILEHLVVGRLKAQKTVNQEELDDIIRYGSKELFADENDEAGKARQIHYDEAAIERLLNRDQIVEEESNDDEDDDLLKAFKVANFEYIDEVEAAAAAAKELARKQAASSSGNAGYWEDLLKDKYQVHQVEALNSLGKGKRSRKQLNNDPKQEASSEDEDHSYENYASESETSSSESSSGNRVKRKRNRVNVEDIPLMEGEGKSLKILGFNQYQRTVFLHLMMRFGWGDCDWKEFIPRLNGKTSEEIEEYGFLFLKHLDEGVNDSPTFSDGVPKEGIRVDDILARHAQITLIKEKLKFLHDNSGASLFPNDIRENYPALIGKIWKEEHDILLLKAILKHGYAKWHAIIDDKELGLIDVACRELSLPYINGPRNDISSSNQSNNGYSYSVTNPAPYHHKEIERRVSEFIRKRYQLLEKLLDLELCLEEDEKANSCDREPEDTNAEKMNQGVPVTIVADTESLSRELPVMEPIAITPVDLPFDNREDRTNMARLYNEMCNVVETSAPDAVESLEKSQSNINLSKNMCQLKPLYEDLLSSLERDSKSNNNDVVNPVDVKANLESHANANGLKPDPLVSNVKEEQSDNAGGVNHL